MRRSFVHLASSLALLLGALSAASAAQAGSFLFLTVSEDQPSDYRGVGFSEVARDWRHQLSAHRIGAVLSERVSLGAELEVGRYPAAVLGLPEFEVRNYQLRATLTLVPFPQTLSPYAGVGIGVDATRFNDGAIASPYGSLVVDAFGLGIGGVGFVGVQLPLAEGVSLFGEGRAGVGTQLGNATDLLFGSTRMSDVSGIAGLRMSF